MASKNALMLLLAAAVAGFLLYSYSHKKISSEKPLAPEKTFAIIKPEAVAAGNAPAIIKLIEENRFIILEQKETTLDKNQAEAFYAVHKDKSFFNELVSYITSGPVVLLVLEKENAVKAWRDLMGATNPAKAAEGTIRKLFGTNIQQNVVHGSDSAENAKKEIAFFFPDLK